MFFKKIERRRSPTHLTLLRQTCLIHQHPAKSKPTEIVLHKNKMEAARFRLLKTDPADDVVRVSRIRQDQDRDLWQKFFEDCAVLREEEGGGRPKADGGSSAFRRVDRILQA